MRLVKCIEERKDFLDQLCVGSRYWMDESSIWKDSDGDKYATFYTYHVPEDKYKVGQFKIAHFEVAHDCASCIYATYPGDCKQTCMVVVDRIE